MTQLQARRPASRVLAVASLGAFVAFLDATVVNAALPSIRASVAGSTTRDLAWVLTAYLLVLAAVLVVLGSSPRLVGRRALVGGIVIFTLASAMCGAAPSVELLVGARALQGLGAAVLVAASVTLVVEAVAEQRRAHAIGLWGAAAVVAAGLGPTVGGAIVELGGWRWVFLSNVPLGIVALWLARQELVGTGVPDVRDAFVRALRLLEHPTPRFDPQLWRTPSFSVAALATVVAGFGFFAHLLTDVLWLQQVWGYGVLATGLALAPGVVVAVVVAVVLGPPAQRHGHHSFVVPGALVWAGAYVWYHQQVGTEPAFWAEWLPGQVLGGIGVGGTLPLLARAALAEVPADRHAVGSVVIAGVRLLGGVLGIAGVALVLGTPTASTVVPLLRDGWLLSVFAFLLVSLLVLPLGVLEPSMPEEAVVEVTGRRVFVPEQRDGHAEPAAPATRTTKGQPDKATSVGVPSPRGSATRRSASRAD